MLCDMQSTSSRNWTLFDVSISNDSNHYTTGISRVLALGEMKTASSKIWTRVNLSISYGDNYGTS